MIVFLLLLIPLFLDAKDDVSRVYAHILVNDCGAACEEAARTLQFDPENKALWEAYLHALAKHGDEAAMVQLWRTYLTHFPEEKENRQVLENMAWGVIEKGTTSTSPIIRNYALLGAFLGQDARGVTLLHEHLRDPNGVLRGVAVRLSSEFRDDKLKDEIHRLLKEERNWKVRLEAIRAAGRMKVREAQHDLIYLVADRRSSAEEKAAAIEALVNLFETADRKEIEKLATSSRAGLRQLASRVVAHTEEHEDLVIPLLKDHNADVRLAALQALGLLRAAEPQLLTPLLKDINSSVAITAAWALTLVDPKRGQVAFKPWLTNRKKETRRLASAALAATGRKGFPLLEQAFASTNDRYMKMNLALGLIGQRKNTREACQVLYDGFIELNERWMWDENHLFRCLAPSKLKHQSLIPNYPEAVNQLTRLEILNILAMMSEQQAQEAIKHFLKEKTWGISGMASALLLTEGDEEALELVEHLLDDSNPKVKVQAALILALWGGGERAISTLEAAYHTAERDLKERILESIGRVGSLTSIPFLIERLEEPYQSLRIIAASSLLQTLYH